MKKEVLINIVGTQTVDGESDKVELFTTGNYYKKGTSYYICYTESETTGYSGAKTTLKVEGDLQKVTMLRSSPYKSHMVIERGRRHQCSYASDVADIIIGVSGGEILSDLGENGGELLFNYSLDIDSALASENQVKINVRSV